MSINPNEQIYLNLLRDVYENGMDRPDRTGTGVKSVFGRQSRYNLEHGLPMLTTKKMELKSIVSELLWFIEGSGDECRLAEIRYGKPRHLLTDKRTIWTDNAQAPYWKDRAKFDGDLGRVYGVQWRKWRTPVVETYDTRDIAGFEDDLVENVSYREVDQLANLINGLKNDPFGRRHILSAWNPGELDQMALPPCHVLANFYVEGDGRLSCMLTQRSGDAFLGIGYNVLSYSIFTHMIAQVCGYEVGEFVHSIGDLHLYSDHEDAAKEQLTRIPRSPPILYIDPTIKNIDDFRMEHFDIIGYEPHPAIKAKMAV